MNAESQQNRSALQRLLLKTGTTASDRNRLSRVLIDLERLAAKGLAEKLNEYAHVGKALGKHVAELPDGPVPDVEPLSLSKTTAHLMIKTAHTECMRHLNETVPRIP